MNDQTQEKQQMTPAQAQASNAMTVFNEADLKLKGKELAAFVGVHNFLEGIRSGELVVLEKDVHTMLRAAHEEGIAMRVRLNELEAQLGALPDVAEPDVAEPEDAEDAEEIDFPDYSAPGGKAGKPNGRPNPELNTTEG